MRALFDRIFERYGSDAVISSRAGSRAAKVFFHSVNSRSWQNMERVYFPLGEIPRGQYICVLPVGAQAKAGETVTVHARAYKLRRVEEMFVRGQGIYCWGLCVEKGGDDDWGSNG